MKWTFISNNEGLGKPPRTVWLAKFLFPKAISYITLDSFISGRKRQVN